MFEHCSPRVRAFTGPHAEEKAERVGHWLKALAGDARAKDWCIERGIGLTRATAESVGTAGGFVAPEDFDAAILTVRETAGAFRQRAEVRRTKSVSQIRPRRTGGLTASFVAEGAAIPESAFMLDAIEPSLKKLAVLARGSTELFQDSAPDLAEFVASEIGYAFAAAEDDVGFNGDGTSTYSGISGLSTKLTGTKSAVAAGSGHNTFLTLDTTDIANLMGGVLATAIPGAAWFVSQLAYAQTLCRLAAVSGGLVATKRADGTIDASYLGFNVVFSSKLPNTSSSLAGRAMLYFGDLRKTSTLVERQAQAVLAISRDRALDTDQVLMRGVERIDLINHLGIPSANIASGSTGADLAPVAMLVGTT
jgi:HK97 family phage major capsid protein